MRKWIKIILSLVFLFSWVILAIVLGAIYFEVQVLWALLIIEVISMLFSLFLFMSNRRNEVKLSWILFIVFVPFFGLFGYWLFGRKFKYKDSQLIYYKKLSKNLVNDETKKMNNLQKYLSTQSYLTQKTFNYAWKGDLKPIFVNNKFKLLATGATAWLSILKDLSEAKEYILLTYYIFSKGELFEELKSVLLDRLQHGVRVYLIYDYAGSFHRIQKSNLKELIENGLRYYEYGPSPVPFINRYANYRNHRKNVVIDGKIGYLGGVNMGDEFINLSPILGVFHDQQLRLRGSAVRILELTFAKDWYVSSHFKEEMTLLEPTLLTQKNDEKIISDPKNLITILDNGPDKTDSVDKELLLTMIMNAKKRIWLSTPYFIPPDEIIATLKIAAKSGVDVRLFIPGITDKMFILDLTRYKCLELFNSGVKIFELNGTFSHSKIGLIDDLILIGSTNIDYRALYSDQQTLAIIKSGELLKTMESVWDWNFKHSVEWREYIINFKSSFYLRLLKLLQILSPIL